MEESLKQLTISSPSGTIKPTNVEQSRIKQPKQNTGIEFLIELSCLRSNLITQQEEIVTLSEQGCQYPISNCRNIDRQQKHQKQPEHTCNRQQPHEATLLI
eukprot:GHVQ01011581.1.p1 GENE.GHVQ01011581.1~~GHVQ01011581.1.p1  ORF type:complete len:101 (-),score=11.84 GHVQ01011581.1:622-924(-)